MKLSVIVPVHNNENRIEKCVKSIVQDRSEWKGIEVILVENNSTDNSWEECQLLEKQYCYVKSIQTSAIGVSAARNIGLDYASGDIIGFCDADDFWAPKTQEVVYKEFCNSDCEMLVGGFQIVSAAGKKIQERKLPAPVIMDADSFLEGVLFDVQIMGSVWNKFYRSDIIKNVRFLSQLTHCEDMYFNVAVLMENPSIKCKIVTDVLYYYVQNSMSATNSEDKLFDHNGKMQYIVADDAILHDFVLTDGIKRKIKGRRACYAVGGLYRNAIGKYHLDKQQEENLRTVLKNDLLEMLLYCDHVPLKRKVKYLYWIMKYRLL